MGKAKTRRDAALRTFTVAPRDEAPAADGLAPTYAADAREEEDSSQRCLRCKVEYLRATTRSARGLSKVYLNPNDMSRWGIDAGAYVTLLHDNSASVGMDPRAGRLLLCGIAWPLDKVKRRQCGINTMWEPHLAPRSEAMVIVQPLESVENRIRRAEAGSLVLQLLSRGTNHSSGVASTSWPSENERPLLTRYLHAMLNGVLVHADARLSVSVHGISTVFRVDSLRSASGGESHAGETVFRISMATAVVVEWTTAVAATVEATGEATGTPLAATTPPPPPLPRGLASIGGLQQEIATIRQIIEQPLIRPELFAKFGLPPPKGLLMFGPPGTGKTMIARALASELQAKIFFINGPEVVSKYIGESERNLRAIFAQAAAQAPSLIFMDEIDAICPKRDARVGEMEKRMVATLLTLMDGLEKQARVVVLAATNRANALDPAIRRPGRFDREVEIAIPTASARLAILQVSLARLPHAVSDQELQILSSKAHGYVGADLSALCKEAALLALQRVVREGGSGSESGQFAVKPVDQTFTITLGDLETAMRGIRPSALREIALDVPHVLWRDIGGQGMIKQQLKEAVEWPLQHPEAFLRMGIRPPKGVLLYGPPGCSKTLTAKALATESGMNFIAIKGPELFSKWVGESEKAVQAVFRKARAAAPTVVFFDEIDAIASQRGGSGSSQVADRVLSQLLTELDGIEPLKQVLVVAATNRPDLIDSALMRPGRIDRVLYVGPPDVEARQDILAIHCRQMPLASDVTVADLATHTDGFSGAELYALCREAAMRAIEEDRDATRITKQHFLKAIANMTPQIDANMLEFFANFQRGRR